MAREKHDKKAGGLIESMDINYSVIWAIKQKPSMTFCPLYVLLRGMKKKSVTSLPIPMVKIPLLSLFIVPRTP